MTDSEVTLVEAENRLLWRIAGVPGDVVRVRWGRQEVTLAAIADVGAGIMIEVTATLPFELEVEAGTAVFYESVPAGQTRYLLTYLDRSDVRLA